MTEVEQLGYDPCDFRPSVEIGYVPAWEAGTGRDERNHELIRDEYGIIRRISKSGRRD